MLQDSDVCACLAVKDMDKAAKFYEGILGLEKDGATPGGTFYTSGKYGVFVYPSQFAGTNKATAAAWGVEDIEAVVKALKDKGVKFERYEDMPDTTIENDIHIMGDFKTAWFKDPDGNILNLVNGKM